MKKTFRYILKIFLGLVVIFILAAIAAVIYVSVNKQKIIRQVTEETGSRINGSVTVRNAELSFLRNFPHISVLMHDVVITDTMFNQHRHRFFEGQEVFVHLNILNLVMKEPALKGIRVQGGTIYLYTDSSGYTNTYLLRPKKDPSAVKSSTESRNELKTILLKDLRLVVNDQKKDKLHDFAIHQLKAGLDDKGKSLLLSIKADIQVNSLAFNLQRGSFIKDKLFKADFNMSYQKLQRQLLFDSIPIRLSGQPFHISGRFDLAGADPQFNLRIHTRKVTYAFVKSAVPEQIGKSLSIVDIDKPLDADADIKGPLKGGDPKVYITWSVQRAHLKTLFLDFDNASFNGYYTNEVVPGQPRKDPNSKVEISHFKADWYGLPVTSAKIVILNLYQPLLTCDLDAAFPLTKLNELIGSNALQLKQGSGIVKLTYVGPLAKNNNTNSFINGYVSFKDAAILYAPRKVEMQKVNGRLSFRNSDVFVENLQCHVLNNSITMQGQARNLLTLINTEPDKANIDWNIYTPSLNLASFLYLLKSRETGRKEKKESPALGTVASKIDNLLERGRLRVKLNAGKMIYKNFEGTNAVADITLLQDRYLINKVSMEHSGGSIAMNGSLVSQPQNLHNANIQVKMSNVNVSKVFHDFENFGQDGITAGSLEGRLNADIVASMNINNEGGIIPASIISRIEFSLKDGALNNYEPVKKIQRFIFKKRDFDNIRFAELKNRLEIANQQVRINRMEIQSSVLTMFVEGVYSPKGATDLSIQVPLSNLKKRKEDYNPENIGADKNAGGSIFIRGRPGEDGTIKFKLDLFNRFDKEKKTVIEHN